MSNSGTTGRIPLWLVGMVVGIAVIGIVSIYLNRKRTLQEKFDFPSNRKGKLIALSRIEVQENQLKGCRNQERFLLSGLIYSFFMFQAVVLMGLNAKSIYFQEEKKIFSNSISREMNFETRVEKTRQMDPNLKLAAAPLANTALPNELNNPPPDAAANQLMNDPSPDADPDGLNNPPPDADPDGLNGPSPAGHGLRARRPRGPNPFDKVRVQERNNPSNRPNGPTA